MSEQPRTIALVARALELLGRGNRGPDLRTLIDVELPAALQARLAGRRVTASGALTAAGAEVRFTGEDLAPGCIVVFFAGDGSGVHVRLDLGGRPLPGELARLPVELHYAAGELPGDHGWWSDVGGLLMVGELAAASG